MTAPDDPPDNAPRAWPTANWPVSPATMARAPSPLPRSFGRPRARPRSPPSPSANWPTPRTPSIPSIRPHAHGPLLPALASARPSGQVRVWSAGCSTGQEAWSIAMAGLETGARIEVVATDLSHRAVEKARLGRYTGFEIQRGLPIRRMIQWFSSEDGQQWQAAPRLLEWYDRHARVLPWRAPPDAPAESGRVWIVSGATGERLLDTHGQRANTWAGFALASSAGTPYDDVPASSRSAPNARTRTSMLRRSAATSSVTWTPAPP